MALSYLFSFSFCDDSKSSKLSSKLPVYPLHNGVNNVDVDVVDFFDHEIVSIVVIVLTFVSVTFLLFIIIFPFHH